jgi:DNA-binding XRE family transcriptional regulator
LTAVVAVLKTTLEHLVRDTRMMLDITQLQLAKSVGVSRGEIAAIEAGKANPTLELVQRISDALGLKLDFVHRRPVVISTRTRDSVHAWCSAYAGRRSRASGLEIVREVEIAHGRSHGWIDLLAFDARTRILYIVEIKTRLDDIGALERQVARYEREARTIAIRLGWRPVRIVTWVLLLATEDVETSIRANREALREAFPVRADGMLRALAGDTSGMTPTGRGLALIDPASRRRGWLIKSTVDGRRSPSPYRDYADAAHRRVADGRPRPRSPGRPGQPD